MELIEDVLQYLNEPTREEEFLDFLAKEIQKLGFDYYAYGVCITENITKPEFIFRNNYPAAWQRHYEEHGYYMKDPTVKHGLSSNLPIIWSEAIFKDERQLWEEAREYGLKSGWAQSTLINRKSSSMLTLARSNDDLSESELLDKSSYITLLSQSVQLVLQRIHVSKLPKNLEVPLTSRELEALKWCAVGKTSGDIGMILGIAERTVNFHIANSITKLSVTNKTAAVARAFQLGLI